MYAIGLFLSGVISIYTLLCFVRIFITWIPNMQYTAFGRFLSSMCDPYLNLFRRIPFLRAGAIDFSPTLALLSLAALSTIVSSIMSVGRITISGILVMIVSLVWSCVQSILGFLILILVIRLIALLISQNYSSPFWDILDRTMTPFIYRIAGTFSRTTLPFKTAIIISLVMLVLLTAGGNVVINLLVNVLRQIPL